MSSIPAAEHAPTGSCSPRDNDEKPDSQAKQFALRVAPDELRTATTAAEWDFVLSGTGICIFRHKPDKLLSSTAFNACTVFGLANRCANPHLDVTTTGVYSLVTSLAVSFLRTCATAFALVSCTLVALPAAAEDTTVQAVGVKFEPAFVYIEPGDTISWEGMAGHNVETIGAMIPMGGTELLTELGENVSASFDEPGIYVYKCTPHWGARMGGVIVVGEPEDAEATIEAYLEAIETDRAGLLPAKGLLKKLRKDMEAKDKL